MRPTEFFLNFRFFACSVLPFVSHGKQDECTWRRLSLTSRNLYNCKQVACSVVVVCFVYPPFFKMYFVVECLLHYPLSYTDVVVLSLVYFLISFFIPMLLLLVYFLLYWCCCHILFTRRSCKQAYYFCFSIFWVSS